MRRHYAFMQRPDQLPVNYNLYMFRQNYKPAWEVWPARRAAKGERAREEIERSMDMTGSAEGGYGCRLTKLLHCSCREAARAAVTRPFACSHTAICMHRARACVAYRPSRKAAAGF